MDAARKRKGFAKGSRTSFDRDLEKMSRDDLLAEVKKLREGIRKHRDSNLHDLCWHHPELLGLLPDRTDPQPTVPAWPQFLEGCIQYRKSLDEQLRSAPRSSRPYPGEKSERPLKGSRSRP